MHQGGRNGVKDLGSGWPQYLKKLRWESTGNVNKSLRKTSGLEMVKQIAGSTVGL
jgi:hypothetical protein